MAVLKGLEPSTTDVTDQHSNQLNYSTKFQYVKELQHNKKTRLLRSRVSVIWLVVLSYTIIYKPDFIYLFRIINP